MTRAIPEENNHWRSHFRGTLALALPLIGAQLAQTAINATDTVMLGWLGAEPLAASVLANTLFFILLITGIGVAQAVTPLAAAASASGDHRAVRRSVRMGLWVALIYAVFALTILLFAKQILLTFDQDFELVLMAEQYLDIAGWAVVPALVVMVLRSYLSALELAAIALWVTLCGVVINGLFNYALIFGNWGAPAMGIRGAATATLITNLTSAAILVGYVLRKKETRQHHIFTRFWRPDWAAMHEVIRLGLPIGLAILAEVGLFSFSSVMMGWFGTITLAAHGIVLQISIISFMVPTGLSQAATVRVGRAYGRRDPVGVARAGYSVLFIALAVSIPVAILFLVFPAEIVRPFLDLTNPNSAAITAAAAPLLAVAGAFQIVDWLQINSISALRGLKDTKRPMIYAGFSYWGIGVPMAYILAFKAEVGPVGVWVGLASGLGVAAVLMTGRFIRRERVGLI